MDISLEAQHRSTLAVTAFLFSFLIVCLATITLIKTALELVSSAGFVLVPDLGGPGAW